VMKISFVCSCCPVNSLPFTDGFFLEDKEDAQHIDPISSMENS